jgi:Flp pilus assembly protein TadB
MALSSLASGALVVTSGWTWLNLGSLPLVLLTGATLMWLWIQRRRTR